MTTPNMTHEKALEILAEAENSAWAYFLGSTHSCDDCAGELLDEEESRLDVMETAWSCFFEISPRRESEQVLVAMKVLGVKNPEERDWSSCKQIGTDDPA